MLGFLIRLLPFWVREPLLIVVGSVFGVRIMYLAVRDQDWTPAAIGTVFLVFTAVRVHGVVRAWRARRGAAAAAVAEGAVPSGAAAPVHAPAQAAALAQAPVPAQAAAPVPAQGTTAVQPLAQEADAHPHTAAQSQPTAQPQAPDHPQPRPQPQLPVQPPAPAAAEKEPNAWGQAAAAIAVFALIAGVLWAGPRLLPSEDTTPRSVSCPEAGHEELPKAYKDTPRAVTGHELCELLNSPTLAQLLGTPQEKATAASASNNTAPLTDGRVALPEAEVTFDTYTVNVSATYNKLSIAQYVKLMKYGSEQDIRTLKVLDQRPAVLSSDHTMKISIDLGGSASGGPVEQGPLARTLTVALDRGDGGGYYDISVWSTSGLLPDDSVLLKIAEKVLPAIPDRPAR
ncbi:DUF6215 domain-containing protein [Streptomyces griseosporeus]|uniref:DUF6215 domain-containing protein n=1 Tax=Streptomyces griseosporeus TaxID=1910 RepID=UPI003700ADE7